MPGINNPRGLVPSRHLSGHTSFLTRKRYTAGRNLSVLRVGDPVYLDTNAEIQRALVATLAGQQWLGVVVALYNGNGRPLVNTIPPVLAASTTASRAVNTKNISTAPSRKCSTTTALCATMNSSRCLCS